MCDRLWLIWKEPIKRKRYTIGELSYEKKNKYHFKYINPELNDAIKEGFTYFPGFNDLNKLYESDKLFANIDTRLPNSTRPDYLEILNSHGLKIESSKMEILKKTRGRLLTDNFEFVPVFDKSKIEFEVAGTRYHLLDQNIKQNMKINDDLELKEEAENKQDKYAIQVLYKFNNKKYIIGYVPRYYSKQLSELLKNKIKYSAKIETLNLDSPLNDEDITASVKLIFDIK